jgi:hypothetical protein
MATTLASSPNATDFFNSLLGGARCSRAVTLHRRPDAAASSRYASRVEPFMARNDVAPLAFIC